MRVRGSRRPTSWSFLALSPPPKRSDLRRSDRTASAPSGGVQFSVAGAREHVELELSPRTRDGCGSEWDQGAFRRGRAADGFKRRPIFPVPPLVQQISALT